VTTPNESIILQPHPDFRITDAGGAGAAVSYLHRDHLASVRLITNAAGQVEQSTSYTPFGDPTTATPLASTPEEHSFIGERFDASTGLLYLNARYYDPLLGRFLQPDWWDPRRRGVGTNRYAYSLNDPINLSDRNGNITYHARRDRFTWDEGDSVRSIARSLGVTRARLRRLNRHWRDISVANRAGTEVIVPRTRHIAAGIAAINRIGDSSYSESASLDSYFVGGTNKCNALVRDSMIAGFGSSPTFDRTPLKIRLLSQFIGVSSVADALVSSYAMTTPILAEHWAKGEGNGVQALAGRSDAAFGDVVSWYGSGRHHTMVYTSDVNIVDQKGASHSPVGGWGAVGANTNTGVVYRDAEFLTGWGAMVAPAFSRYNGMQ